MHSVLIADDRPAWIRKEDKMMACFLRCSLYKGCSSRMGAACNRLGGTEIPKVRFSNGKGA